MTEAVIQETIKQLLADDLQVDAAMLENITPDTPLLGRGIGLDSVEALRLGLGMENAFDLSIPDQDLTAELFATLGTLTQYVYARTHARS